MEVKPDNAFYGQKIDFPVTFQLRLIMTCSIEEESDANHVLAILESQGIRFSDKVKEKNEGAHYYKLKISCTVPDEASFRNMYSALSKFEKVKAAI